MLGHCLGFLARPLVFGRLVTLVLFAIISSLGFREFMSLTPTGAGDHSLIIHGLGVVASSLFFHLTRYYFAT
jgi:predicted CDP-diglyceride synthetase/phosphatidate cytidylyltransferase